MAKDLPINPKIVELMSKATIKNLIDGIVELVTNSDDSYKRIEGTGNSEFGEIKIHVKRQKGGKCTELNVTDFAEGMSREELEKAIEFAGETRTGASIRGLFGRGLKETIIAFGEGEIITIKRGECSKTKLWLDKKLGKPLFDDKMLLVSTFTSESNGTTVNIIINNEKMKVPTYKTFKEQLINHFALRDINASQNRNILLVFEDLDKKLTHSIPLRFVKPEGTIILQTAKGIPGFGDQVKITIYESNIALDSPRNNPFGLAGILIKTDGCILDNQLFKFENEPAGSYFFGEAFCFGLEKRLRGGEKEILDPNRNGLEWKHDYSAKLAQVIERELEPFILKKRKQLEGIPKKAIKSSTKNMLRRLCNLLNDLAQEELDDIPDVVVGSDGSGIDQLTIKPANANIPLNIQRTFSIYAPTEIVKRERKQVLITSDNVSIRTLSSIVKLKQHKKFPDKLWYQYFIVIGILEGAVGTITAELGNEKAVAKVRVAPFKQKPTGRPTRARRGFISDIIPDELSDPPQRVVYSNGIIKVYTRFPSVSKFIDNNFDKIESAEGRLLLSELVGEAFCRELAIKGIEEGKYLKIAGAEIDSFNTAVNELQKKYLHKIQEMVFNLKL